MIDFNLSNKYTNEPIISNDLLYVSQQIDLLFSTRRNDVLGDKYFGSNYDEYVYSIDFGNGDLEEKIKTDLGMLDLCDIVPTVTVRLIEGTERDIALIEIELDKNVPGMTKTYVID